MTASLDLYGGRDPRDLPAYSVSEAAGYLWLPASTVRSWVQGRDYDVQQGRHRFAPLVCFAECQTGGLSFLNLIELSVLAALRRHHKVRLPEIRKAIRYLGQFIPSAHPLADLPLLTDGTSILVERYGSLVNASQAGQHEMRELVDRFLRRVERDQSNLVRRWYPFTSTLLDESVRSVVLDPCVEFGRPCIAGTGVPTSIIAERFAAGEKIDELAGDYARQPREIEEAIRFEFERRAA